MYRTWPVDSLAVGDFKGDCLPNLDIGALVTSVPRDGGYELAVYGDASQHGGMPVTLSATSSSGAPAKVGSEWTMRPLLPAAIALCLQGCLNITTTGYAGYTSTSSTDSTTAAGSSTGGSSSGSTGTSSGGTSSSTGGATSSGTSTGSPPDAGICPGTDPFQRSQTYTLAENPWAMSNSADFNRDGFLDVVVTESADGSTSHHVAVFLGLKDGGLLLASEAADPGIDPGGPLVAADVNNDGWPDLIGPGGGDGFGGGGIVVLLNADGGLTPAQTLIPGVWPSSLAVGDLNQDLIPDIVAIDPYGSAVIAFLGTGGGEFSAPIFVASLSRGAEFCPSPSTLQCWPAPNVPTLFLSDLNGDGFPDVVAALSGSSQLVVALHEPDGGYRSADYGFPGLVVAAPLQVPGRNPGLIAGYNVDAGDSLQGVMQVLDNSGNGQLTKGTTFDVPNRANSLAVADFNLDDLEDVAISDGSLSILFGVPDGGFADCVFLGPPNNVFGALTILGSVKRGHALATDIAILDPAVTVFGDASQ